MRESLSTLWAMLNGDQVSNGIVRIIKRDCALSIVLVFFLHRTQGHTNEFDFGDDKVWNRQKAVRWHDEGRFGICQ